MRFARASLCACIVLAAACGSSDTGPDTAPDTGVDAMAPADLPGDPGRDVANDPGPDVSGDVGTDDGSADLLPADAGQDLPPGATVTVRLRHLFTGGPYSGRTVVLQGPEGMRREATSGADGTATFPAWQGAEGHYLATTWSDEGVLHSRRVPTTTSEIEIIGLLEGQPDPVELSGTASLQDPANWLTVSAAGSPGGHQAQGPDWSVKVPAGKPFQLVALEWRSVNALSGEQAFGQDLLRWQVVDHAGLDADGTLDLDFATPATPEAFTGALTRPGEPGSPMRDKSLMVVTVSSDEGVFLGATSRSALSTDKTAFEYQGEFLRILPESQVQTFYALWIAEGFKRLQSVLLVPGYPGAVPDAAEFLANPVVTRPVLDTFPPIAEPLEWDCVAPGGWCWFVITGLDGVRWNFNVEPGPGTMVLPDPPDGRSWEDLLGPGSLVTLSLRACVPHAGDPNPHPGWCHRFAESRAVSVKRPAVVDR